MPWGAAMARTYSFGYWVRRQRKALDLTQAELGRQVGCAVVTIQKIESDERRPSRQLAERLATFLQVAPEERADFVRAARAERSIERLELSPAPPPVSPLSAALGNAPSLPIPPCPLIGREQELRQLHAILMRPTTRLLTLTGAGGSGKTRLALALATGLAIHPGKRFVDGVWWVDLAPFRQPEMVLPAVAQTLGAPQTGDLALRDVLLRRLRERHLLLVLDNCEHLVDVVADLAGDILATASGVCLLVTSRSLLHLHAEEVFDVPPLPVPPEPVGIGDWETDGRGWVHRDGSTSSSLPTTSSSLMQYDAVQLFVARARAVAPGFTLNDANAAAIATICRLVGGLPLAIELAAAYARALPPAVLLTLLQAHGTLALEGTARDLPARQRTVHAMIQWSYDLLPPAARRVFWRLGVFAGGWSLAAAAAVTEEALSERGVGESGAEADLRAEPPVETNVAPVSGGGEDALVATLEQLEVLLDQSLIVRLADIFDEPRFGMLEPVREFALEQLRAHGEYIHTRRRHTLFFASLTIQSGDEWYGPNSHNRLVAQDAELQNTRIAIHWALNDDGELPDSPLLGMRMASALYGYFRSRGLVIEARGWLEQALARCPHAPHDIAGLIHYRAALAAALLGESAAAREHAESCLAHARALADEAMRAKSMVALGMAATVAGDYVGAEEWMEQALRLARHVGDQPRLLCDTLSLHALNAALSGKWQQAVAAGEEGVAVARIIGAPWFLGDSLELLGFAQMMTGDLDHGRPILVEALTWYQQMDDHRQRAAVLTSLGVLERWQGNYLAARLALSEARAFCGTLGVLWISATPDLELALLALDQGDMLSAEAHATAGVALWREYDDPHGIATAAAVQALVLLASGNLNTAERALEAGLAPLRTQGMTPKLPSRVGEHAWFLPRALGVAGLLTAYRGDCAAGTALLDQALHDTRQPRFVGEETRLHADLGRVWLWAGDLEQASMLLHQAWESCCRMGARPLATRVLQDLAVLALRQGNAARVARLLGAADALHDALGMMRWPVDQPAYDATIAAAREWLGAATFTEVWHAGRMLEWRDAIDTN